MTTLYTHSTIFVECRKRFRVVFFSSTGCMRDHFWERKLICTYLIQTINEHTTIEYLLQKVILNTLYTTTLHSERTCQMGLIFMAAAVTNIDRLNLNRMKRRIINMTENFQSKSARTLYIYSNMSTA